MMPNIIALLITATASCAAAAAPTVAAGLEISSIATYGLTFADHGSGAHEDLSTWTTNDRCNDNDENLLNTIRARPSFSQGSIWDSVAVSNIYNIPNDC